MQDIRFLPVSTTPDTSISPAAYIQSGYARFSHRNEQAEPGYYSVVFDNGIKTELSVTNRCGIHYYQYPANSAHALTIDLTTARNWDRTTETSIRKVNNRTLEGYRKSQGWANDQREKGCQPRLEKTAPKNQSRRPERSRLRKFLYRFVSCLHSTLSLLGCKR